MNQEQDQAVQFSDFNLSPPLMRALEALNFITPSPIQAKTIAPLLAGQDVIGLAQTGTGKTAAFALPILERLDPQLHAIQALILAPTRELAIQVAAQFESLSVNQKGTKVVVLCGGQEYRTQLKALREGAQIVVGTPGRILDHIERGTCVLSHLETFVLDEADEMLRMGFIDDVETILSKLPQKKQMALFSATMPSRIRQIAVNYLHDPLTVELRMETATVKAIDQRFIFAANHQKTDALMRILAVEEHQGVIVFVRTKTSSEEVASALQQHGLRAMAIHGDVTQNIRERVITQFRSGLIDILVATDVAARGLDVERVTHVINYDLPFDNETYVHRIGRTGRAGRSGVAILFVTPKESRMISNIERHTRQSIAKVALPTDQLIQKAKEKQFLAQISARLDHAQLGSYKAILEHYVKEQGLSDLDVAAALALILNKDRAFHQQLPAAPRAPKERRFEGNAYSKSEGSRSRAFEGRSAYASEKRPFVGKKFQNSEDRSVHPLRKKGFDETAHELFRLDVGRVHGVKPGNIVGAIANEGGLESRYITGLKIHDDHSTVQLPKGMPKEVMQDLMNAWVCGRQLKLTLVGA